MEKPTFELMDGGEESGHMKRHEKMTAPRLLEAVYKRPGKPPRVKMIVGTREGHREPCRWGV